MMYIYEMNNTEKHFFTVYTDFGLVCAAWGRAPSSPRPGGPACSGRC